MTSVIAVIAIDAHDIGLVSRFWIEALGMEVVEEQEDIVSLGPPDGRGPGIDVIHVPEPKSVKNRLHLDLRADGVPVQEEVARLLALGATRADVGQPEDASWTVLADPEGNEFCVLGRPAQEAG
ncbi:VOC family protein [Motilibacter aurantiacus]|uniref:VOC family protein n=1 Tax=Motilibacter aurantiacus TaxID=2714955 RepID=UPI00140BC31F|nr:VOC family protein [Motilibacter aurantiacus]NHC46602.1 VOC family protein [Motilibacter aurantiacus]